MRCSAKSVAALALLLLCSGCGARGGADLEVDKGLARQSLITALDAWKAGQPSASLQQQEPPIIAVDYEWSAGMKLMSYELVGDEIDEGADVRLTAQLTLQDAKGAEQKRTALYTVGTEPAISVFRAEEDQT